MAGGTSVSGSGATAGLKAGLDGSSVGSAGIFSDYTHKLTPQELMVYQLVRSWTNRIRSKFICNW